MLPYIIPVYFAALLAVWLSGWAIRQSRTVKLAIPFAILSSGLALWALAYTHAQLISAIGIRIIFSIFQYMGISLLSIGFLTFALIHSGQERRLSRRFFTLLSIEPVITFFVAVSNTNTQWFFVNPSLEHGRFFNLQFTPGPWYYFNSIYTLTLVFIALLLIIRGAIGSDKSSLLTVAAILIGVISPSLALVAEIVDFKPANPVYLTSFAFLLADGAFATAILRLGLFSLKPTARNMLVDLIHDGILILDLDNKVIDINSAAETILEVDRDQLIGHALPRDLQKMLFSTDDSGGAAHEFKIEHNGTIHYYHASIRDVNQPQGRNFGQLVLLHEVTQTRQLKAALRASENQYRLVAEKANDGIVVLVEGKFFYCNPVFAQMLGRKVEEIIGLPFTETLAPEERTRLLDQYKKRMAGEASPTRFETTLGSSTGSKIDVEVNASLMDMDGQRGSLYIVRDMTTRKHMESEVHRLLAAEREQRQLAEALQGIGQVLSATLDFDGLLDKMLQQIEQVLPFDSANLMLVDNGFARVVRTRGYHKLGINAYQAINGLNLEISQAPILRRMSVSGQAIFISDTRSRTDWLKIPGLEYIRSYVGAPIMARGKAIGFISLDKRELNFYHLDHAFRLAAFAGQASLALQNAQLYSQAQQHLKQEAIFNEINQYLVAALSLSDMVKMVYEQIGRLVDNTNFYIALYYPETDEWEITFMVEEGQRIPPVRGKADQGLTGYIIRSRRPLLFKTAESLDYFCHEREIPLLGRPAHSWMGTPLIARDQVVGVMGVQNFTHPAMFSERDFQLFTAIGTQIATSLQNSRLYEDAQRRAHEAETLRQSALAVASTLNLDEAIHRLLEQLAEVVPYDSAAVQLKKGNDLTIVGGLGFEQPEKIIGLCFPVDGDNPASRVISTRRPVIIPDAQAEYAIFRQPPHDRVHAWMGIPLIIQEKIIGVISLDGHTPGIFLQDHARLAETFAGQVAVALENARLYTAASQRAQEAETLRKAGAAVASTLNLEEATHKLLEHLAQVVPYKSASVQLIHDGVREIVSGRGFDDLSRVIGLQFSLDQNSDPGFFVVAERQTRIEYDVQEKFDDFRQPPHNHIHSWMGVPLIVQDQVIGLITLDEDKPGVFTEEHARLAETFANQVAVAIENARLFEDTQRLAVTDALTGLFNRRHFFDLAQVEFERSRRYTRPLSAIMLDIDHFKRVNDTYGHAIGDQVLQEIARRCTEKTRSVDILGRYGGEEFVILLPETPAAKAIGTAERLRNIVTDSLNESDAMMAAERLRRKIAKSPVETDSGPLNITISLGVAGLETETHSLEELLDFADQAMYAAKQAGRNRVAIYSPSKSVHA